MLNLPWKLIEPFGFLAELGFDYVIRLKGNIKVSAADGTTRPAAEGQGGRARKLCDATEAQCPVGAVVCVKGMKEPWCLVASDDSATASQIIKLYSKRWAVESSFRDTKDLRFGMGLSAVRISDPQRRCCCSMPSPSSSSPCSAPPARASAWSQVQHRQHPFLVPPGLHALRPDPQHARTQAQTTHPT
jgi:hypothetical protein